MSTGLNCDFIQVTENGGKPNEHYYILERGDSPKGGWDWREYAEAYGPFVSFDLAMEHLNKNHSNPGGFSSGKETLASIVADPVLNKLIFTDRPQRMARERQYASRVYSWSRGPW